MSKRLDGIRAWWRRLPQKTRVQLIASALLLFAGTEVIALAPFILDLALMIDVGGMVVVIAALRSSASVSMMQLRAGVAAFAAPLFLVFRLGRRIGDFGTEFPSRWYRGYYLVDRISTRGSAVLLVVSLGLMLTAALSGHA